jgi:carbonic anhydrase/acetyltransferase-like protein (isoleucine patch superfamily)
MLIKNKKTIKIIGFPQSSMTQEYCEVFLKEGLSNFDVILPEDFISLSNKEEYQYIIAFCLDMNLRTEICELLDVLNLDCVTYINDNSYTFKNSKIGKGSFVAFDGVISWNCDIGNHCYFGMKSGIGHDVVMGRNCVVSPGVLIAGKTLIGNNCMFMFKSSVLNKLIITDNVTLGSFSNLTKNADTPGNYVGSIARLVK